MLTHQPMVLLVECHSLCHRSGKPSGSVLQLRVPPKATRGARWYFPFHALHCAWRRLAELRTVAAQ